MKKSRILNSHLNRAIATLGHGDLVVIADAGFPIPDEAKRIDLAIEQDVPTIVDIFDLMKSDFIYERCIVAEEQKKYNPKLFERIAKLSDRCAVETVPHEEFIRDMPRRAKYIIRTGAFEPWGNMALISGVDAPIWFRKEGTVVPDYYEERAGYEEGEDGV